MFGKKKIKPQIDQDQLVLIQNAQSRIKQKKRLYFHTIFFIFGAITLIMVNLVFKIRVEVTVFEKPWFVSVIVIWFFILVYHALNVYVFDKFMGRAWEKAQLDKLIVEQKIRVEKLKHQLEKEDIHIARSEMFKEEKERIPNNFGLTSLASNNLTINNPTLIVAVGEKNEIGKDNKLIWHLSDDLKRFKKLTSGHHIIMGRKTFESFPKPLPNRVHIVITRQEDYDAPHGVIVVNSIEKAIEKSKNDPQPYIIGGGEIYKQALPFSSKIEMTRVHHAFDADVFFPEIDLDQWKEIKNEFRKTDNEHKYEFSFITYERIQNL